MSSATATQKIEQVPWIGAHNQDLIDAFACAALTGLLADHKDHEDECLKGETCPQAVARLAYDHAEFMMKERQKRINQ